VRAPLPPATAAPPPPPPPPARPRAGRAPAADLDRHDLGTLTSLVEAVAPEFPERADEWRIYLTYLADYADSEGTLPRSFDALVWDVFGDLLDRA
jgi:hypothetical protein